MPSLLKAPYASKGYIEEDQVSSDPVRVHQVICGWNKNASTVHVMLFNRSSKPPSGDKPDVQFAVSSANQNAIDFGAVGYIFDSGCYLVVSSTPEGYTALGSSDVKISVTMSERA